MAPVEWPAPPARGFTPQDSTGARDSDGGAGPGTPSFLRRVRWGLTGWRPQQVVLAPQQIGTYGDAVLHQRWKNIPGVQLRSSLGLRTGWFVPAYSDRPYWAITVTPGNLPGGQRAGGQARVGSLTPWTAAQMLGRLRDAQARQTPAPAARFYASLIAANVEPA